MKRITTALLVLAGLIIIAPAVIERTYVLAGVAGALTATGVTVLHLRPTSRCSDIALLAEAIVAIFVVLSGLHPAFGILAFSLQLSAWNIGHRFGHIASAVADHEALRRMSLRLLFFSLVPALLISGIVTVFLHVRVQLSFALGLALSVCVLLLLALFVRFAWSARRDREES